MCGCAAMCGCVGVQLCGSRCALRVCGRAAVCGCVRQGARVRQKGGRRGEAGGREAGGREAGGRARREGKAGGQDGRARRVSECASLIKAVCKWAEGIGVVE